MTIEDLKAADEVLAKVVISISNHRDAHEGVKPSQWRPASYDTTWNNIRMQLQEQYRQATQQRIDLARRFADEAMARNSLFEVEP